MNTKATTKHRTRLAAICALVAGLVLGCILGIAPIRAEAAARAPREGSTFTVDGTKYKVTDEWESSREPGEVQLVKYGSNKTNVTVNTVKYQGKLYEVESIGRDAFNNTKGHRVVQVTLGRNVEYVGARAFYGCNKLKTLNIAKADIIEVDYSRRRGFYLDELEIGRDAFKKAGAKGMTVKSGNGNANYNKVVKNALTSRGLTSSCRVVK